MHLGLDYRYIQTQQPGSFAASGAFAFATNLGHFNVTTTDGPEAGHVQSAASIAARQRQYEVSFADIRPRISRSKSSTTSSGVGPVRNFQFFSTSRLSFPP